MARRVTGTSRFVLLFLNAFYVLIVSWLLGTKVDVKNVNGVGRINKILQYDEQYKLDAIRII